MTITAVVFCMIQPQHTEAKIMTLGMDMGNSMMTGTSCVTSSVNSKIYCFGGKNIELVKATDAIVEIETNTPIVRTLSAKLPQVATALSCAEHHPTGKIYCFGGTTLIGSSPYIKTIIEFDVVSQSVKLKTAKLPTGRSGLACEFSSSSKKIYCLGGFDGSYDKNKLRKGKYGVAYYPESFTMVSQITEYSPENDSIKVMSAQLPRGVDDISCTESSVDKRIYCFGGQYADKLTNAIGSYDPLQDKYTANKAKLSSKTDTLSCAENANQKIYCFGGTLSISRAKYNNVIQEFDPKTNKIIKVKEKIFKKIAGHSCTSGIGGPIYCFGGNESVNFIFN